MDKILKFINLDFVTIKPYITLKNLIIIVIFSVFVSVMSKNVDTINSYFLIYLITFMAYPFAAAEISQMDVLYLTLPISKRNMVISRYLFSYLLLFIGLTFSVTITFILSFILKINISLVDIITSIIPSVFIYLLITSYQIPLYYKFGYTKSKPYAFFPVLFLLFLFVVLVPYFSEVIAIIVSNALLFIAATLILLVFIIVISINLSIKFYSDKDI